jgi:predicted RNA-binding Zn ribbon-like protein
MSSRYTGVVTQRTRRKPVSPELRFDAGTVWLNLLATVGSAYSDARVERLRGVEELHRFLAHHELAPVAPLTDEDVAEARELRETLRPLTLAALGGEPVEDVAPLQRWLDADQPLRATTRDGVLATAPPSTARAALGRIARQALEQLSGPEREHLGACAAPDCRMAFLDRGGRRRWCAPELCGVLTRVRAHRARARNAADGDHPPRTGRS